ncbi:unnamed protein product [Lactuca saligna]|uniref:Uncharacterized protein n=1 Tax=Lactuca saligna TaxID=75948 RepID=A0AA36E2T7_LACSI|nr:unnamed protein product [Lactuca saligna]
MSDWKDGEWQIKKFHAKVVVGDMNSEPKNTSSIRKVKIGGRELSSMSNVQSIVLAEVREATSISNLINLCSEEGFSVVKIRYILLSHKELFGWKSLGYLCVRGTHVFSRGLLRDIWGSILFSDDNESNCMSAGKVCVLTGVMASIQESVWVNIEGKDYQIYVKEVALWEPDMTDDGSFVEESNNFIGSFDEGEDESFGLNSDKENEEYDQNHEDDNVNEVNSETEPVHGVGKSDEAGNDEMGMNKPPNASVPLVGIASGSSKRIDLDNMQSEDQRSSYSISKPPGFGR